MKNSQYEIKLVLIGGYNSGKTKFCEYLVNNKQNIDFLSYPLIIFFLYFLLIKIIYFLKIS